MARLIEFALPLDRNKSATFTIKSLVFALAHTVVLFCSSPKKSFVVLSHRLCSQRFFSSVGPKQKHWNMEQGLRFSVSMQIVSAATLIRR